MRTQYPLRAPRLKRKGHAGCAHPVRRQDDVIVGSGNGCSQSSSSESFPAYSGPLRAWRVTPSVRQGLNCPKGTLRSASAGELAPASSGWLAVLASSGVGCVRASLSEFGEPPVFGVGRDTAVAHGKAAGECPEGGGAECFGEVLLGVEEAPDGFEECVGGVVGSDGSGGGMVDSVSVILEVEKFKFGEFVLWCADSPSVESCLEVLSDDATMVVRALLH